MPKKVVTPWEIAKPLLEELYLAGEVTDDMPRGVVYLKRPEFQKVNINNFGNNWLRMKKSIGTLKRNAIRDRIALQGDRLLYPIDHTNQWDQSLAQALLKQDISNDFHVYFLPKELWLSREEYKKFDIKVFTAHYHQEIRSKKEKNYWLVKKAKKEAKQKANDEFDENKIEFFVDDN